MRRPFHFSLLNNSFYWVGGQFWGAKEIILNNNLYFLILFFKIERDFVCNFWWYLHIPLDGVLSRTSSSWSWVCGSLPRRTCWSWCSSGRREPRGVPPRGSGGHPHGPGVMSFFHSWSTSFVAFYWLLYSSYLCREPLLGAFLSHRAHNAGQFQGGSGRPENK